MSIVNSIVKNCSKCGISKTAADFYKKSCSADGLRSECKACSREYFSANAESRKAYAKENYAKNRDSIIAYQREYRELNADRVLAYAKERYLQTKVQRIDGMRKYRAAFPSKMKIIKAEYRKNNAEKVRAADQNKRARRQSRPGSHTAGDIKSLLKMQRSKCAVCRKDVSSGYHVDHIVPLSNGGTNDKLNLQILCSHCNLSKHAKDPLDFMRSRGFLL